MINVRNNNNFNLNVLSEERAFIIFHPLVRKKTGGFLFVWLEDNKKVMQRSNIIVLLRGYGEKVQHKCKVVECEKPTVHGD